MHIMKHCRIQSMPKTYFSCKSKLLTRSKCFKMMAFNSNRMRKGKIIITQKKKKYLEVLL